MRRLLLLLLALCLGTLAASAQQTFPKPTGYVDDFAHALSPEAAQALETQAAELHDKTRAQVFIVTIDSLHGNDIKPFANDLFHAWKIGEKGTDRGALLLFAIADHKWRIEVGSGLEGILNDAKVGDIGRYVVPQLKLADYDFAAQQAFSGVANIIAADAHVTLAPLTPTPDATTLTEPDATTLTELETTPTTSPGSGMTGTYILFFFGLFAFLALLLILAVLGGRSGGGRSAGSSGASSGSSFSSSDSSSSSSSSDSSSFSGGDGGDSSGGGADGSW